MARPLPGILPYTLIKIGDTPTLVFLVWRDRRSSATESSSFWGHIACPLGKEDNSALDAVVRVFSAKTLGCFAPNTMVYENEHDLDIVTRKGSERNQRIEESRLAMRRKLRQGVGVTLLAIKQFITYVAPVRFVPARELKDQLSREKGETEWISAQDLFAALYSSMPDSQVNVRAHPFDTTAGPAVRVVTLPLALPFVVTMRTQEARSELAAILKQFNVNVPFQSAAAPAAAASSAPSAAVAIPASAAPDLDSVSLEECKSSDASASAAASSAAAAASASPAAPARQPQTYYSCRKCRQRLFTDLTLAPHSVAGSADDASGGGSGRFAHKHLKPSAGGARRAANECSSLFVDPLLFGSGLHPEGEGPLQCDKCSTRYGKFNWSGEQCSCGAWIVPAFQITKSKVDERPVAPVVAPTVQHFHFTRAPFVPAPARKPSREDASAAAAGEEKASSTPAASASLSLAPPILKPLT